MAEDTTKTTTGGTSVLQAPIEGVTLGRPAPSDDDAGFERRDYFTPEYYEVNVPFSVKDKGDSYESTHRAILWQDDNGVIYAIGQGAPNVNRMNELEEFQYVAEQQDDGNFKFDALNRSEFKNPNDLSLVIIWSSQTGIDGSKPRLEDETWRVLENRGALLFDPTQLDRDGGVYYPDGTPVYEPQDLYLSALGRARAYLSNWSNDIVRTRTIGSTFNKPRIVKHRKGFQVNAMPRVNPRPKATPPAPAPKAKAKPEQSPADPPVDGGSALEQEQNNN